MNYNFVMHFTCPFNELKVWFSVHFYRYSDENWKSFLESLNEAQIGSSVYRLVQCFISSPSYLQSFKFQEKTFKKI